MDVRSKPAFKQWCEDNGYTAREVATATGMNLRTIYSYMQGTRNPNRRNTRRFVEVYGERMRDIFSV